MLFYHNKDFVAFFRNTEKFQNLNTPIVSTDINPPEQFISVVTRCMNRLHDVRITLPENLEDNKDYRNAEFVLLDYGSTDGLEDWVRSEMMPYIESGRLNYYRTTDPKFFQPNHSQNVTFRLAKGNLVANVDTDNFTHEGYLKRLNQCASVADRRILIAPESFLLPGSKRFFLKGRFALYRNDIMQLGGFDEDLDEGFSHDDVSFVLRCLMARYQLVRYEDKYIEDRIPTPNSNRIKHVRNKNFKLMKWRNENLTARKLCRGILKVNKDKGWGKVSYFKNFGKEQYDL